MQSLQDLSYTHLSVYAERKKYHRDSSSISPLLFASFFFFFSNSEKIRAIAAIFSIGSYPRRFNSSRLCLFSPFALAPYLSHIQQYLNTRTTRKFASALYHRNSRRSEKTSPPRRRCMRETLKLEVQSTTLNASIIACVCVCVMFFFFL